MQRTFSNGNGASQQLGYAVAIDGAEVLIAVPFLPATSGNLGRGAVLAFDATIGPPRRIYRNPTIGATDSPDGRFGASIHVGDEFVAIGMPTLGAPNHQGAGAVAVFERASASPVRTLLSTRPALRGGFGTSIAGFDDGRVLIGAPGEGGLAAQYGGSVYVFDPASGALRQNVPSPTGSNTDGWGQAVATAGNQLFLGAPDEYEFGVGRTGLVFSYDATSGASLLRINHPEARDEDLFGAALATAEGRLFVGAPGPPTTGNRTGGNAYSFDVDTGAHLRTFRNPAPDYNDHFGYTVAAAGNLVAVSAIGESSSVDYEGRVYLFDGESGALLSVVPNPQPGEDDFFGRSLALSRDHLLVGAPEDDAGGPNAGAAYLYSFADGLRSIGHSMFADAPLGATNFSPPSNSNELAFTTVASAIGDNPAASVTTSPDDPDAHVLRHRSMAATTTFETVDLRRWTNVSASLMYRIDDTGYEAGDFLRVYATNGQQSISILNYVATDGTDALDQLAGDGFLFATRDLPADWTEATLVIATSSNSQTGAERFDFSGITLSGVAVPIPEPPAAVLALVAVAWCAAIRRKRVFAATAACIVALAGASDAPAATMATWAAPTSGAWSTASRWSTNPVYPNNGTPTAADRYDVDIGFTGPSVYEIEVTTPVTVDSLRLVSPVTHLRFARGDFTAVDEFRIDAGYVSVGGVFGDNARILDTHLIVAPGALLRAGSTFSNVTLTGRMSVPYQGSVRFADGFTLDNGRVEASSSIALVGSQAIDGMGEIYLSGNTTELTLNSATVTLGPGITVLGAFDAGIATYSNTLINYGTIRSAAGRMSVGGGVDNRGIIEVPANTTMFLQLNPNWRNTGRIIVDGGDLGLSGVFDQQLVGPIERNGGRVLVVGQLDNVGKTVTLDATTGDWDLSGYGQLRGGRIVGIGGARLYTSESIETSVGSRFRITDHPIFDIDVVPRPQSSVIFEITDGMAVNRTWTLAGQSQVRLMDDQTLDGVGDIVFGSSDLVRILPQNNALVTIGPDLTIRTGGGGGSLGGTSPMARGVNLGGTISAENAGGVIRLREANILNNGLVQATGGGEVLIEAGSLGTPAGVAATGGDWRVTTGSRIRVEGSFTAKPTDEFLFQLSGSNSAPLFDVGGAAAFAGAVRVSFAAGYTPSNGSSYRLFGFGSRTGSFSLVDLPPLSNGFAWNQSALLTSGVVSVSGPTAPTLARSDFNEPAIGASNYVPPGGAAELGFVTTTVANGGVNPLAAVANVSALASSPAFVHRSFDATTTFDAVSLSGTTGRRVSLLLAVANTGYETGDFVRAYITNGAQQLDIVSLVGDSGSSNDPLEAAAAGGAATYALDIPSNWTTAQLILASSSNSSQAAEQYAFDQIRFTGFSQVVQVPEPSGLAAVGAFAACLSGLVGARRVKERPARHPCR